MSKKNKQSANYLNFIPEYNEAFPFEIDEEGKVTIFVENKGLFNHFAQKLLKKPKVSQIHLDEMGNFIWPLIDGQKNVYDIAGLVKEEFGEKAEPLYNRLVQYMRNLENYQFIKMKK
ncbi:MAG: PqqD family protein [Lachnospiraceae bacterium]